MPTVFGSVSTSFEESRMNAPRQRLAFSLACWAAFRCLFETLVTGFSTRQTWRMKVPGSVRRFLLQPISSNFPPDGLSYSTFGGFISNAVWRHCALEIVCLRPLVFLLLTFTFSFEFLSISVLCFEVFLSLLGSSVLHTLVQLAHKTMILGNDIGPRFLSHPISKTHLL